MSKNKQADNATANFDFTLTSTDGYSHGTAYNCDIAFRDGGEGDWKRLKNRQTIYTYTQPKVGGITIPNPKKYKATDEVKFTYTGANNRTWNTNLEKDFKYRIKTTNSGGTMTDSIYTNWYEVGGDGNDFDTYEYKLSNGALATMEQRVKPEYDGQVLTHHVKRYNVSANWESSEVTNTFQVFYRPKIGISSNIVSYKKNDSNGIGISQGQIITNDSNLTGIYISWSYDTTPSETGAVQGYRVRIYDYNNNQVGDSLYTQDKYITIPKSNIPRLNNTYIDITPYYKHNETDVEKYWYYNGTIDKIPFVSMVCELDKPQITYPINNSEWINKDFRICFQLPDDGDHDYVTETYEYENIEVKINNQIFKIKTSNGTSTGSVVQDTIYSCLSTALTYQRKVIVWPNKATITTAGSYQLSVRVKKKYGTTSTEHRWSSWSDIVVIYVTEPVYNVNQHDLILATHFNDLLNTIDRIRSTYDIDWTNKQLQAVRNSTIIKAEQYSQSKLLNKLVETKERVNNYGIFDTGRTNIKFDSTNQLPTTFNETRGEYITADKDGTFTSQGQTRNGRNYIKYAYDRCKLLK